MTLDLAEVLVRLRASEHPGSAGLLLFGEGHSRLARRLEAELDLQRHSLGALAGEDQRPGAISVEAVLVVDAMISAPLIGAACRGFPAGVLAIVRRAADQSGQTTDDARIWLAFGFRLSGVLCFDDPESAAVTYDLYEYRLRDYKPVPRWLNARFWANPERFGVDDGSDDSPDYEDDDDDADDDDDLYADPMDAQDERN